MISMRHFSLQETYTDAYPYVGHNFNRQKAVRYILRCKRLQVPIEATAYHQIVGRRVLRVAVELSSMFSCPIGCRYCASGALGKCRFLTADEIAEQGFMIAQSIPVNIPIHFCFQGIGEPSLIVDRIRAVCQKLLRRYPHARFKISTMCAQPDNVLLLAPTIPWETIQITLPHYDNRRLQEIFSGVPRYDIGKTLHTARLLSLMRPDVRIKFNYLCIRGFNDDFSTIKGVVDRIRQEGLDFTGTIELKISFLNQTDIARKNKLQCVPEQKLYDLLQYAKTELHVGNAYVFGPMRDIKVGCGQLIKNVLDQQEKDIQP